jgi:hypothetical protein
MNDGFPKRPKILRGAFVEFGLSLPPLIVVFQFNPVEVTRTRSLQFGVPRGLQAGQRWDSLREFHTSQRDLIKVRDLQSVSVAEETIRFEIRLDASDDLDAGDEVAELFGIAPRLATLELMVQPQEDNVISQALSSLLGKTRGFSFTKRSKPPLVLFIWGRKRVMPVNINGLAITETEYSTDLNPIRARVAVDLTVIEGRSVPQQYTNVMKEAMSALNLQHLPDLQNVVIPT